MVSLVLFQLICSTALCVGSIHRCRIRALHVLMIVNIQCLLVSHITARFSR